MTRAIIDAISMANKNENEHKANLKRMDLYNPYVYDNYGIICSGKSVHEPKR